MRPTTGMDFDTEGNILRNAAPLAPPALRDEFRTVMLAYEQVQDRADGAITADQAPLIGTQELQTSMAAIDEYTERTCGVHVAQAVPTPPS